MNLHIHKVISVEIDAIDTQTIPSGQYSTRKIVVKTTNGLEFELVLFAELPQHLDVTSVEPYDEEQSLDYFNRYIAGDR
jgi:hypothetical protein